MTAKRKAQVCDTLREFIARLRSMDAADKSLGLKAAENLESTLALLESDFDRALPQLTYDIGGRGILDWAFTREKQSIVNGFCDKLWNLIHPKWWEFWK